MEADGGADASIIRSLGEMVPEGAPAIESETDVSPGVENIVGSSSSAKWFLGRSKKSSMSFEDKVSELNSRLVVSRWIQHTLSNVGLRHDTAMLIIQKLLLSALLLFLVPVGPITGAVEKWDGRAVPMRERRIKRHRSCCGCCVVIPRSGLPNGRTRIQRRRER